MARFEHDGLTLAFSDEGAGPPIVLLHGLSLSRQTWDRFVPDLVGHLRVVRLDQRGHGESSHAAGTYVLDTYIADTVALLEEIVREPGFLVGHSLGGVIAHGIAQLRPDLVGGVLLEDPPLYVADRMRAAPSTDEPASVAQMFPLMQQMCRDMQARNAPRDEWVAILGAVPSLNGRGTMADVLGPDGVRAMAEDFSRLDPDIFTPAIDGRAIDGEPDLAKPITCPAVVLRADPDLGPAFTGDDEARFLETNPRARVVLVGGASHAIHDEQPARFLDEVLSLATSLTS